MSFVEASKLQNEAFSKMTVGISRNALEVRSACEIAAIPLPAWRIKGILPRHGIVAIYGPPGCGKSFLAMDMCFAIASGRDWFSRTTDCPVLYVAAEAGASMGPRIMAHFAHRSDEDDAPVSFITIPVDLFDGTDLVPLVAASKKVGAGVIVVDTLARVTAGADENSPSDMGRIVRNLADLAKHTDALVIVVHHSGKDAQKGPRGHTALIAAVDVAIEVQRETGGSRSWRLVKSRDGKDGIEHAFNLRAMEIAKDGDGDSVTSCCVETAVQVARVARQKTPLNGKNERTVMSILAERLRESKLFGEHGAPAGRPVVALDDLVDASRGRIAVEPKRHRERLLSAVQGIIDKGHVVMREDHLWIA